MCTSADFAKISRAEQDIIAYKIVTEIRGKLTSEYPPRRRTNQSGFMTLGRNRQYIIGKTHKSTMRSTPGFYCYTHLSAASCSVSRSQVIIEVKIPAGTKIVEGKTGYERAASINCERLTVKGLV